MKTMTAFSQTKMDSPFIERIRRAKIEFSGVTLYLCDRVWGEAGSECVFDGQLHEPLIVDWGTIEQGRIDPHTLETGAGKAELTVLNDVPVGGADSFAELFKLYDPHFVLVTISYHYLGGTAADDVIEFMGTLEDIPSMMADQVTITLTDIAVDILNKFAIEIVDTETFLDASPDDVGKMLPQAWGEAKGVPFRGIAVGGLTTLAEEISISTTGNVAFSDVSKFPSSGTVQIAEEKMSFSSKSDANNTLYISARGVSGTDAAAHSSGEYAAEVRSSYVYALGQAIKGFVNIYVEGIRILSGFNAYTGQTGDEHADWPGRAVIEFTALPTIVRETDLEVNDGIGVTDDIQITTNLPFTCWSTDSHIGGEKTIDAGYHNEIIYINYQASGFSPQPTYSKSKNGYMDTWFFTVEIIDPGTSGYMRLRVYSLDETDTEVFRIDSGVITTALWEPFEHISGDDYPGAPDGHLRANSDSAWDGEVKVRLTKVEVTFFQYEELATKEGSASKTGEATLQGNQNVETIIGGRVTADLQGYQDDGAGTYTGTPDALIERPDHIFKHMIHRCGKTASQIDATSYAAAGAFYAAEGWALAPVLLQKPDVRALFNRLAQQARSIQFWEAGVHHLKHLVARPTTDKTIEANRIDLGQIWLKYTDRALIRNRLSGRYDHDWSGYGDDVESDKALIMTQVQASINKYGILEGEQLSFAYISNEIQARTVLAWLRDLAAYPLLAPEFAGGYYLADLERGDIINFTFSSGGDLDKALLKLVSSETDQFIIIDMMSRPDAAIQIEVAQVIDYDALLIESGDELLTEGGDAILL